MQPKPLRRHNFLCARAPLRIAALAVVLAAGRWSTTPAESSPWARIPGGQVSKSAASHNAAITKGTAAGLTGNEILQQMVKAYKSLKSLRVTSDADVQFGAVPGHQKTLVEFTTAPAQVLLVTADPLAGTAKLYANGRDVVTYSGISNVYTRKSTAPDMAAIVSRIDKEAPQLMSPLVFLASSSTPTGVGTARLDKKAPLGTATAYIVRGAFTSSFLENLAQRLFGKPLLPNVNNFTLWIDTASKLLLKSEIHIGWLPGAGGRKPQPAARQPRLEAVETFARYEPNAAIPSNDFRFVPPKGAKEVFVEKPSQVR